MHSLEMNLNYTIVDISKELGRSHMVVILNLLSFPLPHVRDKALSHQWLNKGGMVDVGGREEFLWTNNSSVIEMC